MRRFFACLTLFITTSAFAGYDSTYSKLALEDPKVCKNQTAPAVEGEPQDGGEFLCKGYANYSIIFAEGDLRHSVGFAKDHKKECFRWQSFSGFNAAGTTVEWRLKDKTPIATILRWSVSHDPEDSTKTKDWLVVSKLSENGSCHMGYVEGSFPKANDKARALADTTAETFTCDVSTPVFVANPGTKTDDIVSSSSCQTP